MEAPLGGDTRLCLEISVSKFDGEAISWQKFLIPQGLEIGAMQEGITDLVQRLMALARNSDQNRSREVRDRIRQEFLARKQHSRIWTIGAGFKKRYGHR